MPIKNFNGKRVWAVHYHVVIPEYEVKDGKVEAEDKHTSLTVLSEEPETVLAYVREMERPKEVEFHSLDLMQVGGEMVHVAEGVPFDV